MRTIEYEGMEFEYDERCILSFKWQKAMNSNDGAKNNLAIEQLFAGRDEEYADMLCENGDPEQLDTALDAMAQLVKLCVEAMGRKAKN